jgi:hypothetical protein
VWLGAFKKENEMRNNRSKIAVSAFLVVLVLTNYSFSAAPIIDSVSGTIQNSSIITISGSNMIDLNTVNWQYSASRAGFEGSSLSADGFFDEDGKASYQSNVRLMGNKALRVYSNTVCQGVTSCGAARVLYNSSSGSDLYASGYILYAPGSVWPDNYLKMYLTSGPNQWYFQPSPASGGPTSWLLKQGGWFSWVSLPAQMKQDRWYHWEIRMRTGSPNIFSVWWDGVQIANINPSSGQNIEWVEFGIPNYDGVASGEHVEVYFDNVVHSNSRIYPASKIEVSNSSTYGQGTIKWQPPIYLSDSSVQVKLDLIGISGGTYYLWVTNNKQERSAAAVISGGSGDTTNPAPPAGLTVIGQ